MGCASPPLCNISCQTVPYPTRPKPYWADFFEPKQWVCRVGEVQTGSCPTSPIPARGGSSVSIFSQALWPRALTSALHSLSRPVFYSGLINPCPIYWGGQDAAAVSRQTDVRVELRAHRMFVMMRVRLHSGPKFQEYRRDYCCQVSTTFKERPDSRPVAGSDVMSNCHPS